MPPKFFTVRDIIAALEQFPADKQVCTMTRAHMGCYITSVNYVGLDRHGNLVIALKEPIAQPKAQDVMGPISTMS